LPDRKKIREKKERKKTRTANRDSNDNNIINIKYNNAYFSEFSPRKGFNQLLALELRWTRNFKRVVSVASSMNRIPDFAGGIL
jgi:hypothetical protein